MKLSVVIPVYNGSDFIQKSYNSIIDQNVPDFEIIYVDNNSTDDSISKIKQITNQDDRVKLLLQTKQGAAPSRNLGIQNAKGDYVYLFDVDDEIYPEALNEMIKVLDTYPDVETVFGKMMKSYHGISETLKTEDETFEIVLKEKPFWGLYWFGMLKNVVGPPAFLYRRTVFDKIGYYNENLRIGEDTALDIKLGMLCNIAFIDRYVYLYFKHQKSSIQTAKRKMTRAFMIWPRLVKEHLPFYLTHDVPLRFKQILCSELYQSMGRQIYFTKGYASRAQLRKQLQEEMTPLKVPFLIRFYLLILGVFPLDLLMKFYKYKLVPIIVSHIKD